MSRFELLAFSNPAELAQSVADRWLQAVQDSSGAANSYCVALSGGRIASHLFRAIAESAATRSCSWEVVHFFWGDERCVPPDHPESNFGLANELLLKPLGISKERIHRVNGEEAPVRAAAQAEAELRRLAPTNQANQPVLNLIFLGLGEDGHIASLFPGESAEVVGSPAVFRPVIASKLPAQRITLGYGTLAAARQVWVLVSGPGKVGALRESLSPQGRTPLARLLQLRSETRIFTDIPLEEAALEKLQAKP